MFPPSPRLTRTRRLATLHRSVGLLRAFRFEQARPELFYGYLAEDTARILEALHADCAGAGLSGRRILDVGGGPGYFSRAFAARDCGYVTVEPDAGEMSAAGIEVDAAVRGSGTELPFLDGVFDLTYSSNVAEHIPDPWAMGDEMVRVTRPGGLVVLSYTVWLGPFGGHETGVLPHYIGGGFARDRYTRRHGHPPKNVFGESLFDVSCAAGLKWARSSGAEVCGVFPRYHPAWAWWMVRVPVLREFAVSNLVIVLRRRTELA
nr:class I SAM-dependent methyltransferase [Corynebacterium sp. TAE3-ERU16]